MAVADVIRSQVVVDPPDDLDTDIAIIGSGMGGGTLSYALRDTGARVLLIEQGDFLPVERENWSFEAVHLHKRYKNSATWHDQATGKDFLPGNYHYVGGNTKLYGATLPRFREYDFEAMEHVDGMSPAWPISYADLEPFYGEAEQMFWVHSNKGEDPTDPWRSTDYPFPGLPTKAPWPDLSIALDRKGCTHFRHLKRWIGATVAPACCATHATRSPAWWTPKATQTCAPYALRWEPGREMCDC